MSSSSSSILIVSNIYIFVNVVKFVYKLSVGVKFPHTTNSPDIFYNERTSCRRQLPRNKLATSYELVTS